MRWWLWLRWRLGRLLDWWLLHTLLCEGKLLLHVAEGKLDSLRHCLAYGHMVIALLLIYSFEKRSLLTTQRVDLPLQVSCIRRGRRRPCGHGRAEMWTVASAAQQLRRMDVTRGASTSVLRYDTIQCTLGVTARRYRPTPPSRRTPHRTPTPIFTR